MPFVLKETKQATRVAKNRMIFMSRQKAFGFLLTRMSGLVRIKVELHVKPLYNRRNMACKFLPGDRKSLDYGGKSSGGSFALFRAFILRRQLSLTAKEICAFFVQK